MVVKFTDFPNFRLKYLENQARYFNQRGLNHVLGFLKPFISDQLISAAFSPLKRRYPAFHLIFYTMILFMKMKDLHDQVMVKNK